jgi:hypothetical protein
MFNRVKRHLLTQMKQSTSISPYYFCAYRGTGGLKCAIGCLIPDKKYTPSLEARPVTDSPVMEAAGIKPEQLLLAQRLQIIHDACKPQDWATRLKLVASDLGLLYTGRKG